MMVAVMPVSSCRVSVNNGHANYQQRLNTRFKSNSENESEITVLKLKCYSSPFTSTMGFFTRKDDAPYYMNPLLVVVIAKTEVETRSMVVVIDLK